LFSNTIKEKIFLIFNLLQENLLNNKLQQCSFSSTLMFNDLSLIEELMNFLQPTITKWILLTSYDYKYRFNSVSEDIWKSNLLYLQKQYHIRSVTHIILSEFNLKAIINNDINLKEIKEFSELSFGEPFTDFTYTTKEVINKKIPDFLPKRSTMLYILMNEYFAECEDLYKFFDKQYMTDDVLMDINCDGQFELIENRCDRNVKLPTDNSEFCGYCDTNQHMIYKDILSYIKMKGDL
jgi:hypothetical protein